METEKNIHLTVVRPPEDDEGELRIDLALIFVWIKRLFVLWLALAVAFGALAGAVGVWQRSTSGAGSALAVIGYTNARAEKGLDPNGKALDMGRLQSAALVQSAMESTGIGVRQMDKLRRNIQIESVLTDAARDRVALYYNILNRSASTEAVKQLLDTSLDASRYIVSFDYRSAGLSREQGVQFLNALLDAYRDDYENTYNFSESVGSLLGVLDYRDYDYSEQAMLFSDTLDGLEEYITSVKRTDALGFRSAATGYSFDDLLQLTTMLKEIELDQVRSYISINSVTSDSSEREITYYEWLIEDIRRQKSVEEEHLASLTDSIAAYEKDPVVYTSSGEAVTTQNASKTDYYDSMVMEKLEARDEISAYSERISYYEDLLAGLRTQTASSQKAREKAETYLSDLSGKTGQLIRDVRMTVEEYYSKAALANTVEILVPAVADEPKTTAGSAKKYLLVAEAGVLVFYLGAACVCGVKDANPRKKTEEGQNEP